jgi:putative ABC transport system permease protein
MKRGFVPWRPSVREEVEAELAFHLEMTTRELMESGMTRERARAEAERRFGDTRAAGEACRRFAEERNRRARRTEYRDELRQDLSFALRQLARAPGFSAVAIATLALGIGATAAVFGALDAVVLRPLPFPHSERIVMVSPVERKAGPTPPIVPEFFAFRSSGIFENVAGVLPGMGISMKLGEVPEVVAGARVSASYFDLFGVPPEAGRAFGTAEDVPEAPKVAVISDRLWTERFNRDRGIIGRAIQIDGVPQTIIGVMPRVFDARGSADVLLPLALPAAMANDYSQRFLTVYARLKSGQSVAQAEASATAVDRRVMQQAPGRTDPLSNYAVQIQKVQDQLVAGSAGLLYMLLGAVGFVLLIGCTNVANLLLARAMSRSRELAVRAALGAGRARLMRQLLTENLVLAAAGAVAGLAIAAAMLRVIVRVAPRNVPRIDKASLDWRVLLFTLGLGLASCLVFGLLPALRAAGRRVFTGLRDGGRSGTGVSHDRLRGSLVSIEVALAITLLIASGLLLRSAWIVQHIEPGFDPQGVFTARVTLPPARYASTADVTRAFARIRDDAARIPGVRSVALTTTPPLGGVAIGSTVSTTSTRPPDDSPTANARIVSPGYFATAGIALRAGRDFLTADDGNAPKVAVINEALARVLWPGQPAAKIIGQRLNGLSTDNDQNVMEVIGIAADARDEQITILAKPAFFVPVSQAPAMMWPLLQRSLVVVLKSATPSADANALARPFNRVIAGFDPSLPVADPHTLTRALQVSQATARATTLLLSALGGIALLLAMVGIYGVVAYFVGQRTQEIGLRIALGATDARIWRFVARQSLTPVMVGIVAGIALSIATTRQLDDLLYGVRGWDPLTLISTTAVLAMVAVAATIVPARRAMRIAPATSLSQR